VDMIPGPIKQVSLRAMGFAQDTVPALKLGSKKIQGSRQISRELDRVRPQPPLFPSDPEERGRVEEAELWGDEVLQPSARRMIWNGLGRDRSALTSYSEGAKLRVPTAVAARTGAPVIAMARRRNQADDQAVARDFSELPGVLAHVDGLIADGVIGGEGANAADFQIAPSVRLMLTMDDLRPAIESRPAGELAMRLIPDFPGRLPPVFPRQWLQPLRAEPAQPG